MLCDIELFSYLTIESEKSMKYQIALSLLLISFNVMADTSSWTYIKTPRGTDLGIKITKSFKPDAKLLVVAPG